MFIICKKCKKGIIAKIVSDKMLLYQKRQSDYHPIYLNIFGPNWDTTIACTLCGERQYIECKDNKIIKDTLTLKEYANGEENPTGPEDQPSSGDDPGDTAGGKPGGSSQPAAEPAAAK